MSQINDGNSITGWIDEVPNLYPRIEFAFRRMTCAEFAEYSDLVDGKSEKKAQELIAAQLAGRISRWDYRRPDGQVRDASKAEMLALPRALSQRLWFIVAGLTGPDGIVGQDKSDEDAEFNAAMKAAETGRPLINVREEEQRKNSPSA